MIDRFRHVLGLAPRYERVAGARAESRVATDVSDAFQAQAALLASGEIDAATIVDGGAYLGELTARYLDTFPHARVWAIEPAPANHARPRFRTEPRVTVVEAALADAVGERTLALNDADMMHSLLPLDPSSPYPDYPVAAVGEVRVRTVDLDSFCRAQGIKRIAILKLDIQGAEAAVLAGAAGLLAEGRIDLLFTEICFASVYIDQTPAWRLLEMLESRGYRLFALYNARHSAAGQLKWATGSS
jgi:FkbM family methyltransferase